MNISSLVLGGKVTCSIPPLMHKLCEITFQRGLYNIISLDKRSEQSPNTHVEVLDKRFDTKVKFYQDKACSLTLKCFNEVKFYQSTLSN